MADTTYDLVRRCPRCQTPGKETSGRRLSGTARGSRTQIFSCVNNRCRWFETPWLVEIMPDGSIHPAITNRSKNFPALRASGVEQMLRDLQRMHEATMRGGAELRR